MDLGLLDDILLLEPDEALNIFKHVILWIVDLLSFASLILTFRMIDRWKSLHQDLEVVVAVLHASYILEHKLCLFEVQSILAVEWEERQHHAHQIRAISWWLLIIQLEAALAS